MVCTAAGPETRSYRSWGPPAWTSNKQRRTPLPGPLTRSSQTADRELSPLNSHRKAPWTAQPQSDTLHHPSPIQATTLPLLHEAPQRSGPAAKNKNHGTEPLILCLHSACLHCALHPLLHPAAQLALGRRLLPAIISRAPACRCWTPPFVWPEPYGFGNHRNQLLCPVNSDSHPEHTCG